eukprot:scaffold541_cov335-Pavlova_lutheri.AAC.2
MTRGRCTGRSTTSRTSTNRYEQVAMSSTMCGKRTTFGFLLAKELLENPWVTAELETERHQALPLRPLLAVMGDLGGGSAHRLVALEEVMRTSGKDTQARKVTQRRYVMCGEKAPAACQTCHKPSEGVVDYFFGPYTGRNCFKDTWQGCPPRDDGGCHGGRAHTCTGRSDATSEA